MTATRCLLALAIVSGCVAVTTADDGARAPDFKTEVLPVLTKAGCNSAACHGAAIGRGGFRLSLLGYDPDGDYDRLVHEFKSRRVNLASPEKSLLLLKPSRQLSHKGGRRLPSDQEGFEIVHSWLSGGAPRATSDRHLERLELTPVRSALQRIGEQVDLSVKAHFSDGSSVDVTRFAVYEPNDKQAVRCSTQGKVTVLRRGQSSVMVRFLEQVDSVTVTVPLDDRLDRVTSRPESNFIDRHINRTLDELRLDHSPPASDETWLRRAYLDVCGTLPTPQQQSAFLNDEREDRRVHLLNELMDRDQFVDHWAYKWSDLLRVESSRLGGRGAAAFHNWIKEQLAQNTPWDVMARRLLSSRGDSFQIGEANFHRVPRDARQQAEYVSQVFLGVRLQCANCHNHPLDRWTQDDYHGLAAIFSKVDRGQVVQIQKRGQVTHPRTGEDAIARIPGARNLDSADGAIGEFVSWLTAKDNQFFARSAVNRVWYDLMGRGLVEPLDDHRASNPATHPELLDELANDFVRSGYDIRHLIKTIMSSAAYQRSSLSSGNNLTDDRFYARAYLRPLSPNVLVDAVSEVTGVPEKFTAYPEGTPATSLADSRVASTTLDLLGRCDRLEDCSPASGESGATLPLTLHVINGAWLNDKLEDEQGRLSTSLSSERTDAEIVEVFFRLAYCRLPTQLESDHWQSKLAWKQPDERREVFRDFLWAVLNSTEFRCLH